MVEVHQIGVNDYNKKMRKNIMSILANMIGGRMNTLVKIIKTNSTKQKTNGQIEFTLNFPN